VLISVINGRQILIVVFFIQITINTNASMYSHAVAGVSEQFGVSKQVARIPQMAFLVAYGFGCELWAPWSEEFGRWPIQQLSLFLVNLWQIPCGLSKNYATYVVFRIFGGLSTAGGSVTLGVLADMWTPDEQEYAVAFLVLSSVGGSVVGAILGAFVEEYLPLPWIFWMQLIIGGVVQLIHLLCNPETRSTILLDREAKRRRKSDEDPNIYGPNEIRGGHRITLKEVGTIFWRYVHKLGTTEHDADGMLDRFTCSLPSPSCCGSRFLAALAMRLSSPFSSLSNQCIRNGDLVLLALA